MAGVGQVRPGLNIPSPSELAGGPFTPVVTPSAVTQMTDALRQGFLTADDIIARTGKRAQLKEKADVMALTEQLSPEAVQARQQNLRASLAQSELGAAQATAALPLVQPTADLTRADIEEKQAEQTYGTGVTAFKALSSEAGIPAPLTPDGKPDWAERAKIGIDLIKWKQNRDSARERLIPVQWKESNDGSQLLKFNKSGELISEVLEQTLARQALQPFSQIKPGTAEVAPTNFVPQVIPRSETPENISQWRAQLINEGIDTASQMSDQDISRIMTSRRQTPAAVQPQTAVASPKPTIEISTGARTSSGFSLGPPKPSDKPTPHYTETQQKALTALARSLASENILLNKQQQADPNFNPADVKSQLRMKAYKGGTTGQIAATLGQITNAERQYATASNAWIQGLLRAESGAAIAAKEQTWYENTFFPAVGDPPAIQQQKNNLRKAIEQTFEQVIQGKMSPEEYQNYRDTISATAGSSTTPAPQGQTFEIQGIGKVFRGSDGKMYRQ